MSHKTILFFLLAFLVVSFTSLALIEQRASDPNLNKDWWALYFVNPNDINMNFTIENHSNAINFTYEITQDNNTLNQTSLIIPKGESRNIFPDFEPAADARTSITVWVKSNEKDKKEIYK